MATKSKETKTTIDYKQIEQILKEIDSLQKQKNEKTKEKIIKYKRPYY